MSSTNRNSHSSNSSDKEKDFLEEEFLKCNVDDLPIPKEDLEKYEKEIQEVMKSGCNRQIAEYVISEYKKLEDEEAEEAKNENKEFKKLWELKNDYSKYIKYIINRAAEKLIDQIDKPVEGFNELEGYEDEIDKLLDNATLKEKLKDKNINDIESYAMHFLKREIDNLKNDEKEEFEKTRKIYIDKREAVIEAALRKIKKIVNDDNEYKIFYKNYYGKEEPKDE